MGLAQALNRLDVIASALHTGAHPDDESSALMAWLSRGQGARTAYLAINRGEGGQDLIGPELFEELGVIRTEELLAARRFDRAEQFFTPNMDFGFSKTADESFEKWGRANVLGDFVRVIRQFRPEVIFSRFTGTGSDGHGHHQVAGIITQEAFKVAADPTQFPEYGKPWQVKKLYINAMGGAAGNNANTVTINVGEFDTALGRSYAEISSEGRSMHRSQGEGTGRTKGPSTIGLRLAQKTVDTADSAPFAGVLKKVTDLGQLEPSLTADLTALQRSIDDIRAKLTLARPAASVPALVDALNQIRAIRAKATHEHVQFVLDRKTPDFEEALRLASGVVVDVVASDDTITPGQQFTLTVSVINGGPLEFPAPAIQAILPAGWTATAQGAAGAARLAAGQKLDRRFQIQVAADAKFTEPYWLRQPRMGDRFVWPAGSPASMPFDAPAISARVEMDYSGATVRTDQPAEFRRVDNMLGELRSAVQVVPAVSVQLAPEIAVVPLSGAREKTFTVTLENQNTNATDAVARLITPNGWTTTPAEQTVRLTRPGEKRTVSFNVSIPASAGNFTVRAVARAGAQEFNEGYTTIAYPHIETHYIHAPASSTVKVFDVRTRVTSVGYVEGAGDHVPEALEQLGINVTRLSAADLATGDLSRFPTIVLGVRAYGARADLVASNARLLEYVNDGGTLIVQYNRSNEVPNNIQIGPYPFTMTSNNNFRVTHEEAPMRILDPSNPVFNAPNRITAEDFDGWIQERGIYFLSQWDAQYKPLLSSNDPGEQPLLGGLVATKYGKGNYVYTGYVFFRELPAGVKGAYRLFANLVSLN
jgi:LmbE family N-acetylglucosaminyl deacetylase